MVYFIAAKFSKILVLALYVSLVNFAESLIIDGCTDFNIVIGKPVVLICKVDNKSEYQNFIKIPIQQNYSSIEISNKKYSQLRGFIFTNLIVITLTLTRNEIESISEEVFSDLKYLVNLDLKENKLTSISNIIKGFSNNIYLENGVFNSLKTLKLTNNQIESIDTYFTSAFENVEILYLDFNSIMYIEKNAFLNLKTLFELDMSYNNLATNNEDLCQLPKSLKTIKIRN